MVTEQQIQLAAEIIRRGGLVAFPTETVYGLGANALDAVAVAGIFALKGRPRFDPLIVHLADPAEITQYAAELPAAARALAERFWPGPLSLVLPKQPIIPDIVTAGLPSVAIRCPAHETARALIRAAGVPLAAPSANRFGAVSPTTAAHVREQFGDQLTCILDAGPCDVGLESTVVGFNDREPTLLRPGGVTREALEEVIGPIRAGAREEVRPASPGQLPRHYSPTTPLRLLPESPSPGDVAAGSRDLDLPRGERVGLLALQPPGPPGEFAACEYLSATGCLHEAAANLFAALRRLDAAGLDLIVAQPMTERGLGLAIMDRLRRAAAQG